MNDELGPEDRTLGTALSRAVEAQAVPGTRFEDSRLGVNMNKPRRGSFLFPVFATVAAILVGLFVGTSLLNRGTAPTSQVATSPTPTATATLASGSPAASAPVAASPSTVSAALQIFFARDGLPPASAERSVNMPPSDSREARIAARIGALINDTARPPSGAVDLVDGSRIRNVTSVTIQGDLAHVDLAVEGGDWGARGAAATLGVLQQLVYAATEDTGVRQVKLTQNRGQTPTVDQMVLSDALTREDVNGYETTTDERLVSEDEEVPATATTTISNETVAPALGRLAIELRGSPAPSGGFWSPRFTAELRRNDDPAVPGKWILQITLPRVTDARAGSKQQAEGTPIIEVRTAAQQGGVTYAISLSDARPWRVSVERGSAQGTMRVLVDIGGHPSAVANGTAVYSPRPAATVSRTFAVSGAARAFEATVSWRVRDSAGREVAKGFTNASMGTGPVWGTFTFQAQLPTTVSGNVTLDVFQASPRDGSDTNKVEIPLQVR